MIKFQDPPSHDRPRNNSQEILDAIQSRPGEWALIKTDTSSSLSSFWRKKPGVEARAVFAGKTNGKCDIYVRWVGDAEVVLGTIQ